jgi:hypothetical protein
VTSNTFYSFHTSVIGENSFSSLISTSSSPLLFLSNRSLSPPSLLSSHFLSFPSLLIHLSLYPSSSSTSSSTLLSVHPLPFSPSLLPPLPGAFRPYGSMDDVLTLCTSHSKTLMVAGDEKGCISLRSYPSEQLFR